MKYKKSVFIFRRDFRLFDNTTLIEALENSEEVIPIFIFDENLINPNREKFNSNVIQFMIQSLKELDELLKEKNSKLYIFSGDEIEILNDLNINAIYENKDYSTYANKRAQKIKEFSKENNIDYNSYEDYSINSPDRILNGSNEPYKVFTPFWKRSILETVNSPIENDYTNYFNKELSEELGIAYLDTLKYEHNDKLILSGGRKESLAR